MVNVAPQALPDAETVAEDARLLGQNVLTDNGSGADADGTPDSDVLTVTQVNSVALAAGSSLIDLALTSGALLTIGSDGGYTYNPNGQFKHLGAGETATDSFSYVIADGNGGSATANVTITITGVNDVPVAVDDGASGAPLLTAFENVALDNIQVLGNDTDPDGDTLTITKASSADGNVTINVDGTLKFEPKPGFSGDTAIGYTVSDGQGGSDTASVYLRVSPVNHEPAGVNLTVAMAENGQYTLQIADFGFSDPSDSPANTLQGVKIAVLSLIHI